MKQIIIFIFAFVCCSVDAVNYTVIGPRIFRPESEYKFVVSVYGVESINCRLDVVILKQNNDELLHETFVFSESDTSEIITLNIPKTNTPGKYELTIRATGELNFVVTKNLFFQQKTHSLFIQTDKSFYKPGQQVLFRVLGIQSTLKPYTQPINITIYDYSKNKIHQMLNQRNDSGVINGHLKLSDITPLGQWKIKAESESENEEVYFDVAEYVLPKFEVKVILPSYLYVNKLNPSEQKPLDITATATYTFGKPVKGYALITVEVTYHCCHESSSLISKNVELIDGKADISITMDELKQISNVNAWVGVFVQANVTEASTGVILQGNSRVPFEDQRYRLEFLSISSNNFKPGFSYRAHVKLSQADGSWPLLSDIKLSNGSFKTLEVRVLQHQWLSQCQTEIEFHVPLTPNGYCFIEVPINCNKSARIQVSFYDEVALQRINATKELDEFFTRDGKHIQLTPLNSNETLKPKSNLTLNVKTSETISSFHCQILGKGGMVYSNSYSSEIPSDNITFTIFIDENLALLIAPEARIIVSYVTSTGEYVADSLALSVSDYLANKVSLSFDRESSMPGEEVVMRVKAAEDSYVSLLAVDQSVLLLRGGNDITHKMLNRDLKKYADGDEYEDEFLFPESCWPFWLGGENTELLIKNAGLFVASNYHISAETDYTYEEYDDPDFDLLSEMDAPVYFYDNMVFLVPREELAKLHEFDDDIETSFSPAIPSPAKPRKIFPETWIWSDLKSGSNGSVELKLTVPDTITSWTASAFATNTRYGLGISEQSAKLTVLKPFFISLNLPYSIIRGEQFALQATLFNYYGQDLMVDVSLPKSDYFQVKQCLNGIEGPSQNENIFKNVFVRNNDMKTVYFWIIPTSLGQIPIEVKAFAGLAADSMIINLLVKPEGQQESYSHSALIRIPSEDLTVANFDVALPGPDVLVPDSITIEATLIGDIMGTTINNLDKLLQMPYGCGEQNMLTLAPDVYILKYLTVTNHLTNEIQNKALGFINAGYQRELLYKRGDGSFSAFGDRDAAGSVWLSAFVVRVFSEASDAIPIDDFQMSQTILWILRHQNAEGSFSEPPGGKVLHTEMQGGSSSGISLTAYVLISLLVNRNRIVDGLTEKIDLSVSYLESQFESYSQDPYILSIIGYAFYLADSAKVSDVLRSLGRLAIHEDGMTHWHKEVAGEENESDGWRSSYLRPQSNDIEMTSYVLLLYAAQKDILNGLPIAKWLISQRNAEGGFMSTQDTVLGLEALALFGEMVVPPINSPGIIVQVTQDANDDVYTFLTVDRERALFLQSHQLPATATKVTFAASGEGLALVQLNVKFYVKSSSENRLIRQNLSTNSSDAELDVKICVSWEGPEETGMVLTEVNLLTGYTLSDDYAEVIKDMIGSTFKKQEFSNNRLSIYLDELTNVESCFIVKMQSVYYVNEVKPAVIKTYRYYAPGVIVSGYYSPTASSSELDVCDPIFNQADDNNAADFQK